MRVSKAVNYCIDYHKQNSKKKYGQQLSSHFLKVQQPIWRS